MGKNRKRNTVELNTIAGRRGCRAIYILPAIQLSLGR
jgi:hypothetical protein